MFAVACVALGLIRAGSELHPPYPKGDAVRAALRDRDASRWLAGSHWTDARVIALDGKHWRVTFFDGPRYVLDAAVDAHGQVDAIEPHPAGLHPPGARPLWEPALLALFSALFALAVAVRPLRSIRNLDAVVIAAGFSVSALLLDERLVAAHVYAGAATLLYVAARCAFTGLSGQPARAVHPIDVGRLLPAITIGTLAAALIMVVTSTGISDVAFAGMAGGTLLNHGISPYGHITTDVVHGDTYPLLTYVLYMPFAAVSPVRDSFDSLDAALWLNALALVAGAVLLRRWGTRTILAWLAFPPVVLAGSGGGNDVPAAAFAVAALAVFARSELSAGLLTLAGWVKIAPAAGLVPLLARLRGTALTRALALVVALLAAGLVAMLAVGGTDAVDRAITALRFQFERGSWFSLWRQLGAPAVQVGLQALTLAFVVIAALRPRDLRRLAALTATILALLQLSANYWTYAYLPWLLPFILVALFPPGPLRSPQSEPRAP